MTPDVDQFSEFEKRDGETTNRTLMMTSEGSETCQYGDLEDTRHRVFITGEGGIRLTDTRP